MICKITEIHAAVYGVHVKTDPKPESAEDCRLDHSDDNYAAKVAMLLMAAKADMTVDLAVKDIKGSSILIRQVRIKF